MIRRNQPHRHNVLGCHDRRIRRHRNDRIEVSRSQDVREVPEIVGKERIDQREVGVQCRLKQIAFPVDFDFLLAFLNNGADAGGRQHAAQAGATSPDALDEGALRNKVHLHLFFNHLPLRLGIETDVARNGLADQTRVDKLADAAPGNRRIVRDDGEVAFSLPHEFIDDALRRPNTHEAADHEGRPLGDHGDRFLNGNSFHVVHSRSA